MRRFFSATVAFLCATGVGFVLAQAPAKKAAAAPAKPAPAAAPAKPTYPPIPNPGFAPARPADQTRAVYQFAAEHPEVLKYVPCYCGCESSGHPHNESCFVKRRDAKGNVTEWDTHGYG
ncbi:MAG TPA: PCYCGC motif-containing (lipo)protein [Vicinamibacterales bacterium]|nr:PCYCGC motif-containing (lipo)protein [Vicinamibacterales bacterium]